MARTTGKQAARKPALFTIGYEGHTPQSFCRLLLEAGVRQLLDVRYNPISHKPGFSKSALAAALAEAGVDYVHLRALGIPTQYREQFKASGDIAGLFRLYGTEMLKSGETEVWRAAELASAQPTVLMCFEHAACDCHRHVLAKELARRTKLCVTDL